MRYRAADERTCTFFGAMALAAVAFASPMTDADKLYDAGDLKGAEAAYQKVLAIEPDNVFALEGLQSAIRFQPGRSSSDAAAVTTHLQAVQAKPYSHSHSDEQGDAYFRSHDYKNAEPLYREALAADPNDAYARARLTDCLDGQGKPAEAAVRVQAAPVQATAVQGGQPTAASVDDLIATAKDQYQKHQYAAAENAYRQVLDAQPQNTKALQGLGDTLSAENKPAEAATVFEQLADALMHPQPATPAAAPTNAGAPPLPQTAAPAAPLAAPANVGKAMNGLCGYIHVGPQGSLFMNFLLFSPDGHIYTGPPTNESWQQLAQRDASHYGTYSFDGKTLKITFADGKTESHAFADGLIDGDPIQKAGQLQGGTLEGTYSRSMNAMSFGGATALAGGKWVFKSDGTFTHGTYAGTETDRHITGTGAPAGNGTGGAFTQTSGKYTIANGMLTLNGTESHPIYYLGNKTPPWYLSIEGVTFDLQ